MGNVKETIESGKAVLGIEFLVQQELRRYSLTRSIHR